jgi:hypothetical protein
MSEFKSGRGGKRENAGRPPKPESEKADHKHIRLNEELIIKAMALTGIDRPNTAIKRIVEQAIEEALKKRGLDSIESELNQSVKV